MFSQTHGPRFGNMQDIGVATGGGGAACASVAAGQALLGQFYPAIGTDGYNGGNGCALWIGDMGTVFATQAPGVCGADGLAEMWLDPAALGFPSSMEPHGFIVFDCWFWHVNGAYPRSCTYHYSYDGNTFGEPINIYPGALNRGDATQNQLVIDALNLNGSAATCQ